MQENLFLHIDMDAFYASVEVRDDPALRGKPVVVGAAPGSRGVVATASYEARKKGVRSAMSSHEAYARCPEAIFVPPRFSAYREASEQFLAVLREKTPLVQTVALDEAYLQIERLQTSSKEFALHLQEEIRIVTGGLTASIGVAPLKYVSKLASEKKKPAGITVVSKEGLQAFLDPLPVEAIQGMGPKATQRLHAFHLFTLKQVRKTPLRDLERAVGSFAPTLLACANGTHSRRVRPSRVRKSIGKERTLGKNLYEFKPLERIATALFDQVWERARTKAVNPRTLSVKLRYADFKTITRSQTDSDAQTLLPSVLAALDQEEIVRRGVRLIGVALSDFREQEQLELFSSLRA